MKNRIITITIAASLLMVHSLVSASRGQPKTMKASVTQIRGGTARQNARILRNILSGEVGVRRNIVIMNAGAALVAGNKASDLKEGICIAEKTIDSGKALAKLDELIKLSQSLKKK